MEYKLAISSWNNEEVEQAISVLNSKNCTMGKITKEFEELFAKRFNSKYAVFCNSGSSANLLAVAALRYRKQGVALNPGDEVIVPAVSWATTYYPLSQYGLKLKFVDINLDDFNINIEAIKNAITNKTKAICAVNLLGMPCEFDEIRSICDDNGLLLIEDNCESMGATYRGKECGTFGLVGTFSTFFSHHLCTVEGGVCLTDDEEIYQILLSLRSHGWIRNLPDKNFIYNKTGNTIEDTYKFVLPGYNVRPNDIFASIGISQLKKLDKFLEYRRSNYNLIKDISNFKLQVNTKENIKNPSWFGFGFTCENKEKMSENLLKNNIECRPIVSGNFINNPVLQYIDHSICGDLSNAEYIDKHGLFIGNNGEDMNDQINHLRKVI